MNTKLTIEQMQTLAKKRGGAKLEPNCSISSRLYLD